MRGSKEAQTTSKYGLRGTRVGEASNQVLPDCADSGEVCRASPSPVAVSSDEEPLVRPNTGRDVLPRFSAGPIAVPFAGPVVPSELDEPSTQPASAVPTWVDAAVDEDVDGPGVEVFPLSNDAAMDLSGATQTSAFQEVGLDSTGWCAWIHPRPAVG